MCDLFNVGSPYYGLTMVEAETRALNAGDTLTAALIERIVELESEVEKLTTGEGESC